MDGSEKERKGKERKGMNETLGLLVRKKKGWLVSGVARRIRKQASKQANKQTNKYVIRKKKQVSISSAL